MAVISGNLPSLPNIYSRIKKVCTPEGTFDHWEYDGMTICGDEISGPVVKYYGGGGGNSWKGVNKREQ